MTTRELYNAVINTLDEYGTDGAIDLAVEMRGLVSKLDARNEKRKSTDSKEKREAAYRRLVVLTFLTDHKGESFTRDQISFETDLDPAKVTGACTALVKEGSVIKTEIKVEKSRKVAYTAA